MAESENVRPDVTIVKRDLVERCRLAAAPWGDTMTDRKALLAEAADEIEELRWQLRLHQPKPRS